MTVLQEMALECDLHDRKGFGGAGRRRARHLRPAVCWGLAEKLRFALETGARLFGPGDGGTEAGDTCHCTCMQET